MNRLLEKGPGYLGFVISPWLEPVRVRYLRRGIRPPFVLIPEE